MRSARGWDSGSGTTPEAIPSPLDCVYDESVTSKDNVERYGPGMDVVQIGEGAFEHIYTVASAVSAVGLSEISLDAATKLIAKFVHEGPGRSATESSCRHANNLPHEGDDLIDLNSFAEVRIAAEVGAISAHDFDHIHDAVFQERLI